MLFIRAAVLSRGIFATGPGALAHGYVVILVADIAWGLFGLCLGGHLALLGFICQVEVTYTGAYERRSCLPGDTKVLCDLVRAEVEGTDDLGMEVSHRGGSKGIIEMLQWEDTNLRGGIQQEGLPATNRNQREGVPMLPAVGEVDHST